MTSDPSSSTVLRCPACDYNLTGLPQNRCPECGNEFDPHELASLLGSAPPMRIREMFLRLVWLPGSIVCISVLSASALLLSSGPPFTIFFTCMAVGCGIVVVPLTMMNVVSMTPRIVATFSDLRRRAARPKRRFVVELLVATTILLLHGLLVVAGMIIAGWVLLLCAPLD